MVLHHSERGWTAPMRFEDVIDLDGEVKAALMPGTPRFEYLLDDLSQAREEDLKGRAMTGFARLATLCLKLARESPDFLPEFARWGDLMLEVAALNGVEALSVVMRHVLEVSGAAPQKVAELVRQLGPKVEDPLPRAWAWRVARLTLWL